ncbi:MAG: hypothetical protein E7256_13320 [Lachnospiraceae bacterium]|nr:hypothetical protein [Lachnospiraceae bacterium]
MGKKRFTINLFANIVTFVINLAINFALSPFIVKHLGVEANGFVTLSNTVVSYANVFTVALNAMFGRYISIEIHRGNKEKAKKYFSTVFFANCICAVVFSIIGTIVSLNIGNILDVSEALLVDVKVTFTLTFFNYVLGLIFTVFNVCTFVKNRLELSSICNIVQYLIRAVILFLTFWILPAHIYYVPLTAIIVTSIGGIIYKKYTKILTPELEISKEDFQPKLALSIIKEGAWFSLQQINKVLETGLDLLISNQFVSSIAMGSLSIAKTVPNMIYQLTTTIAGVFSPTYAELYAKDEKEKLINTVKTSVSVMSIILMPLMIGFIVYGREFFLLWQPTLSKETIDSIQILSILTVLPTLFNGYVEGLYYINILTNKVKISVIVTFGFSIAAVITEIILLLTTNGGVYIIAGTSAVFMSIRYLFFTPCYCAYVLGVKWNTFLYKLFRAIIVSIVEFFIFVIIKRQFTISSWTSFFISVVITGMVGYLIAIILMPTAKERKQIIGLIKKNRS